MAFVPLALKIANLFAYLFLSGVNVYSGFFEDKEKSPYHNNYNTFITPAPFVFGVCGLIHFLLGGFVIYQFFDSATEAVVDGVRFHFISIALLNTIWLALLQENEPIWAWIVILATAFQVTYVYYVLKYKYQPQNINDIIWIHSPFSLYHAWIFVLCVISTFMAFSPKKENPDDKPNALVRIFVILGILILEGTVVNYVEKLKGDISGAIVITWALYGIACEQSDPWIHWTAQVLAFISTFHVLKPIVSKYYFGSREEQTRLLG
ncbi:hypothetical protein Glove_242g145 [Diversispora epigaea]|uniref:Uncharacterized protein n=1 Tax=Diversispora epigaea TaxID=1348612 RepID=A0A397IC86_9GLOM|nr:hypothetical protein Glove_242g145 [Diversispora epigaea]